MEPHRPESRSGYYLGSLLLVGLVVTLVAGTSPSTRIVEDPPSASSPTRVGEAGVGVAPAPTTSAPAPVRAALPEPTLSPLPAPPALNRAGVFLVLELSGSEDRAAVSDAFDLMRSRDLRTLVFATPDVHPDFLRLALADGHSIGLNLRISTSSAPNEVESQIAAWETLSRRVIGPAGAPLILVPANPASSPDLEATLARLGYHAVHASPAVDGTPGQIVRLQLGPGIARQLQEVEHDLAAHGRVLLPHWLAAPAGPYPAGEQASTPEEFRAAHIVVVDPGHTRVDVGAGIRAADGPSQSERWANVQRAEALQEMLQADGWTVVLTHDDDALFDDYVAAPDVDLNGVTNRPDDTQYRANLAYYLGLRSGRRPVVISLHVDSSSSPDVWGPIFFYPPGGDEVLQKRSYRLALAMQDRLAAAWDSLDVTAPSRGVRAGFLEGRKGRAGTGYDILGTTHIEPAPGAEAPPIYSYVATLVEAGTASHPPESYVLASEEGNRTLARAHREAVNQWMMTEIALGRLSRQPRCPDPAALTGEQIAFLAEQEVTAGRAEGKVIAVTFDAGSGAEPWPAIRAACAEAGLRPTVFLTGFFVRQHPEIVRQMLADGYDLQSHTDTHPNLTELDSAAIQSEFARLQEALDDAVGGHVPLCLWRPPLGARNPTVRRAAAELGLLEVYWSVGGDTTGWRENATVERVIRRVTSSLLPGQIYVMHVGSWVDAEALPSVLAEAEARGYTVGDVWSVLTEEQTLPAE